MTLPVCSRLHHNTIAAVLVWATHNSIAAVLVWVAAVAASGCGDDAHKGKVSHGPHASSSAAVAASPRLAFDPGSPLATALVARRLRNRLRPFGVSGSDVRVVGGKVVAEVPHQQLQGIVVSLAAGRLDVYLADAKRDWVKDAAAGAARHGLKVHVSGTSMLTGQQKYLSAPPTKRVALLQYALRQVGRSALVGPLFDGNSSPSAYRTYVTQPGRTIRGENIVAMQVVTRDGEVTLSLQLTPVTAAAARLAAQSSTVFFLRIDRDVVATLVPDPATAAAPDNELRFVLPQRGTASTTREIADAWAKRLSGLSLSHRVKLTKE